MESQSFPAWRTKKALERMDEGATSEAEAAQLCGYASWGTSQEVVFRPLSHADLPHSEKWLVLSTVSRSHGVPMARHCGAKLLPGPVQCLPRAVVM